MNKYSIFLLSVFKHFHRAAQRKQSALVVYIFVVIACAVSSMNSSRFISFAKFDRQTQLSPDMSHCFSFWTFWRDRKAAEQKLVAT